MELHRLRVVGFDTSVSEKEGEQNYIAQHEEYEQEDWKTSTDGNKDETGDENQCLDDKMSPPGTSKKYILDDTSSPPGTSEKYLDDTTSTSPPETSKKDNFARSKSQSEIFKIPPKIKPRKRDLKINSSDIKLFQDSAYLHQKNRTFNLRNRNSRVNHKIENIKEKNEKNEEVQFLYARETPSFIKYCKNRAKNERIATKKKRDAELPNDFHGLQKSNPSIDQYRMSSFNFIDKEKTPFKKLRRGLHRKPTPPQPMVARNCGCKHHAMGALNTACEFGKSSSIYHNLFTHQRRSQKKRDYDQEEGFGRDISHFMTKDEIVERSSSALGPVSISSGDTGTGPGKVEHSTIYRRRPPCVRAKSLALDNVTLTSECNQEPSPLPCTPKPGVAPAQNQCKKKRNKKKKTKFITNVPLEFISRFAPQITESLSEKKHKGQSCIKYFVFGLLIVVWSPCLLAVILAWVVMLPVKLLTLKTDKTKRFRKKDARCEYQRMCYEKYLPKNKRSFMTSETTWYTRTFRTVVKTLTSLLKINKKKTPSGAGSSFLRSSYPNPGKRYTLFYADNRGWLMKPLRRKNSASTRVVQSMRCEVRPKLRRLKNLPQTSKKVYPFAMHGDDSYPRHKSSAKGNAYPLQWTSPRPGCLSTKSQCSSMFTRLQSQHQRRQQVNIAPTFSYPTSGIAFNSTDMAANMHEDLAKYHLGPRKNGTMPFGVVFSHPRGTKYPLITNLKTFRAHKFGLAGKTLNMSTKCTPRLVIKVLQGQLPKCWTKHEAGKAANKTPGVRRITSFAGVTTSMPKHISSHRPNTKREEAWGSGRKHKSAIKNKKLQTLQKNLNFRNKCVLASIPQSTGTKQANTSIYDKINYAHKIQNTSKHILYHKITNKPKKAEKSKPDMASKCAKHTQPKQAYKYKTDKIRVPTQKRSSPAKIKSSMKPDAVLNSSFRKEHKQSERGYKYKPHQVSVETQKRSNKADNTTSTNVDIVLNYPCGEKQEQSNYGNKHQILKVTEMQLTSADNTKMTNRDITLNCHYNEKHEQYKHGYKYEPHQIPNATQMQSTTADNTTMTNHDVLLKGPCEEKHEKYKHDYKYEPHQILNATQMQSRTADNTIMTNHDIALNCPSEEKHEQYKHGYKYEPHQIPNATQIQSRTTDNTTMTNRDIALNCPSEKKYEQYKHGYKYKAHQIFNATQMQSRTADNTTMTNHDIPLNCRSEEKHEQYKHGYKYEPHQIPNATQMQSRTADNTTMTNQDIALNCHSEEKHEQYKHGYKYKAHQIPNATQMQSRTADNTTMTNHVIALNCLSEKKHEQYKHGYKYEPHQISYATQMQSRTADNTTMTNHDIALNCPSEKKHEQYKHGYKYEPHQIPNATQMQSRTADNTTMTNHDLAFLRFNYLGALKPSTAKKKILSFSSTVDTIGSQDTRLSKSAYKYIPEKRKHEQSKQNYKYKPYKSTVPIQKQRSTADIMTSTNRDVALNYLGAVKPSTANKEILCIPSTADKDTLCTQKTNSPKYVPKKQDIYIQKQASKIDTSVYCACDYERSKTKELGRPEKTVFSKKTVDCINCCASTSCEKIGSLKQTSFLKKVTGWGWGGELGGSTKLNVPGLCMRTQTIASLISQENKGKFETERPKRAFSKKIVDCGCGAKTKSIATRTDFFSERQADENKLTQYPSKQQTHAIGMSSDCRYGLAPQIIQVLSVQASSSQVKKAPDCSCSLTTQQNEPDKQMEQIATDSENTYIHETSSIKDPPSQQPSLTQDSSRTSQEQLSGDPCDCPCLKVTQAKSLAIHPSTNTSMEETEIAALKKSSITKFPESSELSPPYLLTSSPTQPDKDSQKTRVQTEAQAEDPQNTTPLTERQGLTSDPSTTSTDIQGLPCECDDESRKSQFQQHLPSAQPDIPKVDSLHRSSQLKQASLRTRNTTLGSNGQPEFSQHHPSVQPDIPKVEKTLTKFPKPVEHIPSKVSQATSPVFEIALDCGCGVTPQQNEPDKQMKQIETDSKKTNTKAPPSQQSKLTQAPPHTLQEQRKSFDIATDCLCGTVTGSKSHIAKETQTKSLAIHPSTIGDKLPPHSYQYDSVDKALSKISMKETETAHPRKTRFVTETPPTTSTDIQDLPCDCTCECNSESRLKSIFPPSAQPDIPKPLEHLPSKVSQATSPVFEISPDCRCGVTPQQNEPDQQHLPSAQPVIPKVDSRHRSSQLKQSSLRTRKTTLGSNGQPEFSQHHPSLQPDIPKVDKSLSKFPKPLEHLPSKVSQATSPVFETSPDCRCGVTPQQNEPDQQHLPSAQPVIPKVDSRHRSSQLKQSSLRTRKTTLGSNGQPEFSQHHPSVHPDIPKVNKTRSKFRKSLERLLSKVSQSTSPEFEKASDCDCGVTPQQNEPDQQHLPSAQPVIPKVDSRHRSSQLKQSSLRTRKTTLGSNGQPEFSQHHPSLQPDIPKVDKSLSKFPKPLEHLPSKVSQATSPVFEISPDCRCGVTPQQNEPDQQHLPSAQPVIPKVDSRHRSSQLKQSSLRTRKTTLGSNGQPEFSQHHPSLQPDIPKVDKTLSKFPKPLEHLPSKVSQATSPVFEISPDCRCGVNPQQNEPDQQHLPSAQPVIPKVDSRHRSSQLKQSSLRTRKTTLGSNGQPEFSQHHPSLQPDIPKVNKTLSKFPKPLGYLLSKVSQATSPVFGISPDCRCGVTPQQNKPDQQHLPSAQSPKVNKTLSNFRKSLEYLLSKVSQSTSSGFENKQMKQIETDSKKTKQTKKTNRKASPSQRSKLTRVPSHTLEEQLKLFGRGSDCLCETATGSKSHSANEKQTKSPPALKKSSISPLPNPFPHKSLQDPVGEQPYGTEVSTTSSKKKVIKIKKARSRFKKSPDHSPPLKSMPCNCLCPVESLHDPAGEQVYYTKRSTSLSKRNSIKVDETRSKLPKSPDHLPPPKSFPRKFMFPIKTLLPKSLPHQCQCLIDTLQNPVGEHSYGTKESKTSSERNILKVDKTLTKFPKSPEQSPPLKSSRHKCMCPDATLQDPVGEQPYGTKVTTTSSKRKSAKIAKSRSMFPQLPEHSPPPNSLHSCLCPGGSLQDSLDKKTPQASWRSIFSHKSKRKSLDYPQKDPGSCCGSCRYHVGMAMRHQSKYKFLQEKECKSRRDAVKVFPHECVDNLKTTCPSSHNNIDKRYFESDISVLRNTSRQFSIRSCKRTEGICSVNEPSSRVQYRSKVSRLVMSLRSKLFSRKINKQTKIPENPSLQVNPKKVDKSHTRLLRHGQEAKISQRSTFSPYLCNSSRHLRHRPNDEIEKISLYSRKSMLDDESNRSLFMSKTSQNLSLVVHSSHSMFRKSCSSVIHQKFSRQCPNKNRNIRKPLLVDPSYSYLRVPKISQRSSFLSHSSKLESLCHADNTSSLGLSKISCYSYPRLFQRIRSQQSKPSEHSSIIMSQTPIECLSDETISIPKEGMSHRILKTLFKRKSHSKLQQLPSLQSRSQSNSRPQQLPNNQHFNRSQKPASAQKQSSKKFDPQYSSSLNNYQRTPPAKQTVPSQHPVPLKSKRASLYNRAQSKTLVEKIGSITDDSRKNKREKISSAVGAQTAPKFSGKCACCSEKLCQLSEKLSQISPKSVEIISPSETPPHLLSAQSKQPDKKSHQTKVETEAQAENPQHLSIRQPNVSKQLRQSEFFQHLPDVRAPPKIPKIDTLRRSSQSKKLTEKVKKQFDAIPQKPKAEQVIPIISGKCRCAGEQKMKTEYSSSNKLQPFTDLQKLPSIQPSRSSNSHSLPTDKRFPSPTPSHATRKTILGTDGKPKLSQHLPSAQPDNFKINSFHRSFQSKQLKEKLEEQFAAIRKKTEAEQVIPILSGKCRCAGEQKVNTERSSNNKIKRIQPIHSPNTHSLRNDNQRFRFPKAPHPTRQSTLGTDKQPEFSQHLPNRPRETLASKLSQPHTSQKANIPHSAPLHNSQPKRKKPCNCGCKHGNEQEIPKYIHKLAKAQSPGISQYSSEKFQKSHLISSVYPVTANKKRLREHVIIQPSETSLSTESRFQPNPQILVYQQNLEYQKRLAQIPILQQNSSGLRRTGTAAGGVQQPYPDFNRVSMYYPGINPPLKQSEPIPGQNLPSRTNNYPPGPPRAAPTPKYGCDPCFTNIANLCAPKSPYDESALRRAYKRRPLRYTPPRPQLPRIVMENKLKEIKKKKAAIKKARIEGSEGKNFFLCLRDLIDQTEREAWPTAISCHPMWFNALKRKPCFWIYKSWPKMYPTFLNFYKYQQFLGQICVYVLTICFWSPLLMCGYLCCKSC